MYVPDALQRMNDAAVTKARTRVKEGHVQCDHCDNMADYCIPVYNPADSVRDVEGAYHVENLCPKCYDDGYWMEELFNCANCGEIFIVNHSWDVVGVMLEDGMYCQACAADQIEPSHVALDICFDLRRGNTKRFIRMNAMPGKREIWSGEFSEWGDFPGYTSLDAVADDIEEACVREGVDMAYPLVTHGYQFSVVLGVYA